MVFCEVQFLYPSFLWATALVAVPVFIHLFNFRKPKKMVFSDIRFLKQIAIETNKQKQVKHLLILVTRMFMIIALVFAFAQPFIPEASTRKTQSQTQFVSVYLDNSYSMSLNGQTASLLEEAKNKARMLAQAYGDAISYQLLTNNFEPEQQLPLSKKAFLEKIDQTQVSSFSRTAQQVYRKQLAAFQSKFNTNASIYWITDAQVSQFEFNALQIDSVFPVHLVPVEAELSNNIWIDTVWMDEPFIKSNKAFTLHVKIKNNASTDFQNQALYFMLDQKKVNLQNFTCKANQSEVLNFSYTLKDTNWHQCAFTLTDYPLVFDDQYYFSLKAAAQIHILQVYQTKPNPAFDNVFQLDPTYHLVQQFIDKVNVQNLANQQLLIVDGVNQISSGLTDALLKYIKEGGLVLYIPELENTIQNATFLSKLGISMGSIQKEPLEISEIQTKDDLFKQVFTSLSNQTLYPKVLSYFPIQVNQNITFQQILGLNNGKPYAVRKKFGKGQCILIASNMMAPNDQFVHHAFFVPFMLNMPFLQRNKQVLAYSTAHLKLIPVNEPADDIPFTLKKGPQTWQCQAFNRGGTYMLEMPSPVHEAGSYDLYQGQHLLNKIAINNTRSESDLKFIDLELLEKKGFIIEAKNAESLKNKIALDQNGEALWRYFLIVAILLLMLEIFLLKPVLFK